MKNGRSSLSPSSSHCSDESSIHSATDGENGEKVKEGRAGMRAGE